MSNHIKTIILLIIFFPIILLSNSDPCSKLKEEVEKLSCYKTEYEKKDKTLNEVYKNLRKKIDKKLAKEMKLESRVWIKQKEEFCKHPIYTQDSESEKENSTYYSCLNDFTEDRIFYLKKAYGRENVKSGLVGEYQDGQGGQFIINQNKGQNAFSISVVRGPTVHVGQIGGTLKVTQKEYRWKDKQDGENCELNFTFSDYTVKVKEINCASFHGANAYFDGTYRKIK